MPNPYEGGLLLDRGKIAKSMANDLVSLYPITLDRRHAARLTWLVTEPLQGIVSDRYLAFVKAWRQLLCVNHTSSSLLREIISPLDVLVQTGAYSWTFRPTAAPFVEILNRCIMLCYKVRFPTPQSDWTAFCKRVGRSGRPTLDQERTDVLRSELRFLRLPHDLSKLRGRNGPGAVAGGEKGPYKWFFDRRPAAFPTSFFRLNFNHLVEDPLCKPVKYGVTRALQVPKDARGPRFISCEPLEYQHAQYACMLELYQQFRRRYSDYVSLENTNKHCELLADKRFCTVDLKDASDMISRRLMWKVLPEGVRETLFACRSTFTQVGDKIVPLRTFAPMGSSLCFHLMTCVITAAIKSLTTASIWGFRQFGDDGIYHSRNYWDCIFTLRELGCLVNTLKSCGPDSRFRESCGEEWFWDDTDVGWVRTSVRPVYIRSITRNRPACLALLEVADNLRDLGWLELSKEIDGAITSEIGFNPRDVAVRWNTDTQQLECKRWVERPIAQEELVDGYPGLYRWFISGSEEPTVPWPTRRSRWTQMWTPFDEGYAVLKRPPERLTVYHSRSTINGKRCEGFPPVAD